MKWLITIALLLGVVKAEAVDLREYFPDYGQVVLLTAEGTPRARFTFYLEHPAFFNITNRQALGLPGKHFVWTKEYWQDSQWARVVDQLFFFADNGQVWETGGWRVKGTGNILVGYEKASGQTSGLLWGEGLQELKVVQQKAPGGAYELSGALAYSKSDTRILPYHTPAYGRCPDGNWARGCGKTYFEVAHVVMYHGTKDAVRPRVHCGRRAEVFADGSYYFSLHPYNSYGIELFLVKGIGIIEHRVPFIEDGSFFNVSNCNGIMFEGASYWHTFIDDSVVPEPRQLNP